jgi:hypothetical protein
LVGCEGGGEVSDEYKRLEKKCMKNSFYSHISLKRVKRAGKVLFVEMSFSILERQMSFFIKIDFNCFSSTTLHETNS